MPQTSHAQSLRFAAMAAEYLERMGARIRSRREELGMSRSEVARQMPGKTNEQAVYRWENGKNRPHDDTLEALAAGAYDMWKSRDLFSADDIGMFAVGLTFDGLFNASKQPANQSESAIAFNRASKA